MLICKDNVKQEKNPYQVFTLTLIILYLKTKKQKETKSAEYMYMDARYVFLIKKNKWVTFLHELSWTPRFRHLLLFDFSFFFFTFFKLLSTCKNCSWDDTSTDVGIQTSYLSDFLVDFNAT